jgi:hypothetical protein
MLSDISEHHTRPLPLVVNSDFHAYLERYRLTWLDVARASGVPGVTVWSIDHGQPVLPGHASQVRRRLYLLTGKRYVRPIGTFQAGEPPRWRGRSNG